MLYRIKSKDESFNVANDPPPPGEGAKFFGCVTQGGARGGGYKEGIDPVAAGGGGPPGIERCISPIQICLHADVVTFMTAY
jgi:hypothetical protein